jgi:hypothetical protein
MSLKPSTSNVTNFVNLGKNYTARVGPPNPQTLIPPVIADRSLDSEVWKQHGNYIRTGINKQPMTQLQMIEPDSTVFKGYETLQKPRYYFERDRGRIHPHETTWPILEGCPVQASFVNYVDGSTWSPPDSYIVGGGQRLKQECPVPPKPVLGENENKNKLEEDVRNMNSIKNGQLIENFAYLNMPDTVPVDINQKVSSRQVPNVSAAPEWRNPYKEVSYPRRISIHPSYDVNVNGSQDEYYHTSFNSSPPFSRLQADMDLPSNLATSDWERDNRFAVWNRNLHTQTLQPNIYSEAQIIEPINANIGVSFNPQFQPLDTSVTVTNRGGIGIGPDGENQAQYTFTRIDPQLVRDEKDVGPIRAMENPSRTLWTIENSAWQPAPGTVRQDQIYDPRFTGYGPGYRAYNDVELGQVRYYYSDIDAYRRPNFVIRSNIDHFDFADSMGAVKPEYQRRIIAENGRDLVQDQFMNDTLHQRENLMESLMRKRNQELWQIRAAPIIGAANSKFSSGPN